EALEGRIDRWHVASLPGARGADAEMLRATLLDLGVPEERIGGFANVEDAFVQAREMAGENDRIVVFGSFLTVAAALPLARSSTAHR
ncbi:MAG TPA: bifunctional folylpolyglutamate synthase/dihydrofolate synthase, partial [Burkholderiales bacterium]|nr:bifunctional folylpolyglutamate synthase/dihydrofolate synthase [Burkholderiales bacterium]